jgi:hypothetical protein
MALRWAEVDLAGGVVRVERSWDVKEGVIAPKSAVGRRNVPIAGVLRDPLVEHRMASEWQEARVRSHCLGALLPGPGERSRDVRVGRCRASPITRGNTRSPPW